MIYTAYLIVKKIYKKNVFEKKYPLNVSTFISIVLFLIGTIIWYLSMGLFTSIAIGIITFTLGGGLAFVYYNKSNDVRFLPIITFVLGVTTCFVVIFTSNNYMVNHVPPYSNNAISSLEHMISYYKTGSTANTYIKDNTLYWYSSEKIKKSKGMAAGMVIDPFAFDARFLESKYKETSSEFEKVDIREKAEYLQNNGASFTAFSMLKGDTGYIHNIKIGHKYYSFLVVKDSDDFRNFANWALNVKVKKQIHLMPANIKQFGSYPNAIDMIQKISQSKIDELTLNDNETKIPYRSLLDIMNFGKVKQFSTKASQKSQRKQSSNKNGVSGNSSTSATKKNTNTFDTLAQDKQLSLLINHGLSNNPYQNTKYTPYMGDANSIVITWDGAGGILNHSLLVIDNHDGTFTFYNVSTTAANSANMSLSNSYWKLTDTVSKDQLMTDYNNYQPIIDQISGLIDLSKSSQQFNALPPETITPPQDDDYYSNKANEPNADYYLPDGTHIHNDDKGNSYNVDTGDIIGK